ncbi:aminoglycoside phosphotransferase (APT) family kinase protein [Nocardia sp. GAS34]|uniref:phosphotransferase family protein n=1 Tax=unclassified Nocardia TaxID=2637762 RepID=UPI003D261357
MDLGPTERTEAFPPVPGESGSPLRTSTPAAGSTCLQAFGGDPDAYYREANAQSQAAAGSYNRNIRVLTPSGQCLNVRIPIAGADVMDLRQWPEAAVLQTIAPYISAAPRLYWASPQPAYQIHEFIDGDLLDQLAPRGVTVPEHVPTDVAHLCAQLAAIPRAALPPAPDGLDDDPHRFAHRLWDATRRVYRDLRGPFARLYRELRVPDDPFEPLAGAWKTLQPKPFRLIHADLHRKNMIIRNGETVFLDWELALFGDPLCEVAIHLHKMTYLPGEQHRFLTSWTAAEPQAATGCWEHDLRLYLVHEQIKSAVLEAVRYAKIISEDDSTPAEQHLLVTKLVTKLEVAAPLWDLNSTVEASRVEAALRGPY